MDKHVYSKFTMELIALCLLVLLILAIIVLTGVNHWASLNNNDAGKLPEKIQQQENVYGP